MRWATITAVTTLGVWVDSAWMTDPVGPLPYVGATPEVGNPVLVTRTTDGEWAVIC